MSALSAAKLSAELANDADRRDKVVAEDSAVKRLKAVQLELTRIPACASRDEALAIVARGRVVFPTAGVAMPHPHQASLEAALVPVTRDGTVGLGSFISTVAGWLKSAAHSAVDTEEERDALLAMVMGMADRLVAPRLGGLWSVVRPMLNELLDEQMDVLPSLI